MNANIKKLVADGWLDLDCLMEDKWAFASAPTAANAIATYNGDRNEVELHTVHVQVATSHGITAYQWIDVVWDDDGSWDIFDTDGPVLSREEAVKSGEKHAKEKHREVGS